MKRAALILAMAAAPLGAEVVPRSGPGDPHLQIVDYNPEEVIALRAAPGFQMTIELAPDERIENVALGDSGAWQVQANRRGDHVFLKPLSARVATNMTVITDVRRYSFTLYPVDASDPTFIYSLKFNYPSAPQPVTNSAMPQNTLYRLRGSKSLWPVAMSDDDRFTSIMWAPNTTQPAVYRIDERGDEALVNGLVRDGAFVIEGVASRYVFRLGKASAIARRLKARTHDR